MIGVQEAIDCILRDAKQCSSETVSLEDVQGRVCASDIAAMITQPPFSASAMDGYAVSYSDMEVGTSLRVIGEAPAGLPFEGRVNQGEAVRIFTGAVIPEGSDHVIIQEDVSRRDDIINVEIDQAAPAHIRKAGVDFKKGDILLKAGSVMHELHGGLLAAANIATVPVISKPRVLVFSNGDELRDPGSALQKGEIVNANHYAIRAMVALWGGEAIYAGCIADNQSDVERCLREASDVDVIVPIGGASVGDFDVVKPGFKAAGGEIIFEKIAVRPGKPTWYGRLKNAHLVGLPGNPASAIVTAALFLQPLIRRLSGTEKNFEQSQKSTALLMKPLKANKQRESYLRANAYTDNGYLKVEPMDNQDSSLLRPFSKANVLIKRSPHANEVLVGDEVPIVWLR